VVEGLGMFPDPTQIDHLVIPECLQTVAAGPDGIRPFSSCWRSLLLPPLRLPLAPYAASQRA
jgi:hypothetical protein